MKGLGRQVIPARYCSEGGRPSTSGRMRNCCIRPRPEFTFLEEKLHGPMTPISDLTAFKRCLFGIAGHATVARQRDHVFKPQSCWLLQYYYIRVATPYKHRDLNFFRYFSCP